MPAMYCVPGWLSVAPRGPIVPSLLAPPPSATPQLTHGASGDFFNKRNGGRAPAGGTRYAVKGKGKRKRGGQRSTRGQRGRFRSDRQGGSVETHCDIQEAGASRRMVAGRPPCGVESHSGFRCLECLISLDWEVVDCGCIDILSGFINWCSPTCTVSTDPRVVLRCPRLVLARAGALGGGSKHGGDAAHMARSALLCWHTVNC